VFFEGEDWQNGLLNCLNSVSPKTTFFLLRQPCQKRFSLGPYNGIPFGFGRIGIDALNRFPFSSTFVANGMTAHKGNL